MHEDGIGIIEFRSVTQAWAASWDPRHQLLVFRWDEKTIVRIRVDSLRHYREDRGALSSGSLATFDAMIEGWPTTGSKVDISPSSDPSSWLRPFERLTYCLVADWLDRGKQIPYSLSGLIKWLLTQGSTASWLQRYDQNLPYRLRYRLMRTVIRSLSESREQGDEALPRCDLSDTEMRENYWFTIRLQCDLTEEWCAAEAISSDDATKADRQSYLAYLRLLRDEPYRRDLDSFLGQGISRVSRHTGTELEVERVLGIRQVPRDESDLPKLKLSDFRRRKVDENVDRVFFSWFMRRYDQNAGRRLMWRTLGTYERVVACFCAGLISLAFVLFIWQAWHSPPRLDLACLGIFSLTTRKAWSAQVILQLGALFLGAWLSPKCFNLVMPRALFGSLLTWITLIFTSIPGLWAIESYKHHPIRLDVHEFLHTHHEASLYAIPILLVALIFVLREIGQWTNIRFLVMWRAIWTTMKLYAGSLFWGIIFAVPIRHLLEFPPELPCIDCLLPVALIGSSLAGLFGIVVELIWDDKSIAEPLEAPL